jgi:hypothetical protein
MATGKSGTQATFRTCAQGLTRPCESENIPIQSRLVAGSFTTKFGSQVGKESRIDVSAATRNRCRA